MMPTHVQGWRRIEDVTVEEMRSCLRHLGARPIVCGDVRMLLETLVGLARPSVAQIRNALGYRPERGGEYTERTVTMRLRLARKAIRDHLGVDDMGRKYLGHERVTDPGPARHAALRIEVAMLDSLVLAALAMVD